MNKKKLYSEIMEKLQDGDHPVDIYEELSDEYGNLRKNTIFEIVVNAYNAFKKEGETK